MSKKKKPLGPDNHGLAYTIVSERDWLNQLNKAGFNREMAMDDVEIAVDGFFQTTAQANGWEFTTATLRMEDPAEARKYEIPWDSDSGDLLFVRSYLPRVQN